MEKITNYSPIKELKIGLQFDKNIIPVGRLAIRDAKIYFEYEKDFIQRNLEISPLKLPLKSGLQIFETPLFNSLPGVFNDSLPDGWGKLLFDRYVKSQNLLPAVFSPLDRLAYTGKTGLGALVYEPDYSNKDKNNNENLHLDVLAKQAEEILNGETNTVLEKLIQLNGSSAGARPKALIGLNSSKNNIILGIDSLPENFEHWLVKFANSTDGKDAGAIEYIYALMAKKAGIEMMPVHLFEAHKSAGYFATKRFDRQNNQRVHMHTAAALLHANFRFPSLDYENLITLTGYLTKDVREIEKMFRLAVFNVLAHNRDDHGKNFSFLMDQFGEWKLSPAYDLTFSSGPNGHQSTMILGEGQNPTIAHLKELGKIADLKILKITEIIEQTKNALNDWEKLAIHYGVSKMNIKLIGSRILR
jgi:serine/threonine-protein kinase HipA